MTLDEGRTGSFLRMAWSVKNHSKPRCMLIYIWRDNKQEGPFAEHEIREQLQSGRLHRNDFAWAAGSEGWKPLSDLLELDSSLENPEASKLQAVKAKPVAQGKVSRTKRIGKNVLAKAAAAASLLKAQSFRKKRQWVDLRMAEFRVGKKAYDSGVLLSGHEELAAQLIDVQLSLEKLKDPAASSHGKNLLVQAKRCFETAGKGMRWLVLVRKKHCLLRTLGAGLRQADCGDKNWATEASSANVIANEISILDEKMKELERNTYPWARRPIWLATFIMVLLVGCIVLAMVSGPAGRAFSQGTSAIDTGSDGFKAFESQVKAYWASEPTFFLKMSPDKQKAFWELIGSEIIRQEKVRYPNGPINRA
jgi:hypothetical protein